MKRTVSFLVTLLFLASSMLSILTGCSADEANYYTVGEWLNIVENDFGMTYYEQETPYFTSINSDNDLFSVSQIAAEWGVVDTTQQLDVNKKVTREFCADTLVRAMAFDYDVDMDISDAASIAHLNTVKVALNEDILSLDSARKFNPEVVMTKNEAGTALAIARDKWVNLSYDETYNNSEVRDGVVNLGGLDDDKAPVAADTFSVTYSGDTRVIDTDGNYDISGLSRTIAFPKNDIPADIQTGTILTLPADDVVPTSYAVCVDSVTDNGDGTVTVVTHNAEMMDVYENLDVQYSDYLNYDEAVVFDPDGNRISDDPSAEMTQDILSNQVTDEYLDSIVDCFIEPQNQMMFQMLGSEKTVTKTIPLDMFTVKLSYSSDRIDISIEVELEHGKVTFKKQIPKIKLDTKLDIGWVWDWGNSGIKVKTARFVMRYEDSMSFKYSGDWKTSFSSDVKSYHEAENFISDKNATVTHDEVLQQAYDRFKKQYDIIKKFTKKDGKILSQPLFEMVFPTGTGIDPKLVFRLNVSVEGSISLSCEAKSAFGAEVVNNKLRSISESNVKKSASLDGKAEATLEFGAAISALGTTAADAVIDAGLGVKLSVTAMREDAATGAMKEQLALPFGAGGSITFKNSGDLAAETPSLLSDDGQTHVCADFKIYPIVYLELCTSKSLVGKFIGGIKATYMDADNCPDSVPQFKKHIEFEDGIKVLDSCSYLNEEVGGVKINSGSDLELNDEKVLVAVGSDTNYITIQTLPKKYKLKDFEITCDDNSIADVSYNPVDTYANKSIFTPASVSITSASGNSTKYDMKECFYKEYTATVDDIIKVKGIADGTTTFTMKSKDGKYSKTVTVIVGNGGLGDASIGALFPEKYSYNLAPGSSDKITLSAVPKDYNAAEITYSSGDESIVTVDQSGKITGKKEGSVLITIATSDGKYTALVEVNVVNLS